MNLLYEHSIDAVPVDPGLEAMTQKFQSLQQQMALQCHILDDLVKEIHALQAENVSLKMQVEAATATPSYDPLQVIVDEVLRSEQLTASDSNSMTMDYDYSNYSHSDSSFE